MSHMEFTVPKHVYECRLARMAKLIELKAPAIIIYHEARLIMKAYHPSLWYRIQHWFSCSWLGLWLDPEWLKFQLTGKSEVYNPEPTVAEILEYTGRQGPGLSYDTETEDIGYGPGVTEEDHQQAIRYAEAEVKARPPLSCGHTQDNWYSICSAHCRGLGGENCPRCRVGRCIECYPGDGTLRFFNKADGSPANPFPNLRPRTVKAFHSDCGTELVDYLDHTRHERVNNYCPKCQFVPDSQSVELQELP